MRTWIRRSKRVSFFLSLETKERFVALHKRQYYLGHVQLCEATCLAFACTFFHPVVTVRSPFIHVDVAAGYEIGHRNLTREYLLIDFQKKVSVIRISAGVSLGAIRGLAFSASTDAAVSFPCCSCPNGQSWSKCVTQHVSCLDWSNTKYVYCPWDASRLGCRCNSSMSLVGGVPLVFVVLSSVYRWYIHDRR